MAVAVVVAVVVERRKRKAATRYCRCRNDRYRIYQQRRYISLASEAFLVERPA